MQDNIRGKIHNRERAQQIKDFQGLRFGNITPTDIDGLIEYKNKLFIIIELKFVGNELPFGQKLALERLCYVLGKDRPSILFIGIHNCSPEIDIPCALIKVKDYYFHGWKTFEQEDTLKSAIDRFINKYAGAK